MRVLVWFVMLLLAHIGDCVELKENILQHINFGISYDVFDVNDSTLLLLVDYHDDVFQPPTDHTRNKYFHAKHYARMSSNAHMVHRRLCELLGRKFFPHKVADPVFIDVQNWRGRVIATREAHPANSCRFQLEGKPMTKAEQYAFGRNSTVVEELDTLSLGYRAMLPEQCDQDKMPLMMTDRCKIRDLDQDIWPWTATGRMRVSDSKGVPKLQGEAKRSEWLGGLPSAKELLNLLFQSKFDEAYPRNEGYGHRASVRLGGDIGIPVPRVLQSVRGRNKNVRTVSPFGLVEDRHGRLASYSAVYNWKNQVPPGKSAPEKSGESFEAVESVCRDIAQYEKLYADMETCFASSACPFVLASVPEDCCTPERDAWIKATQNLKPQFDGSRSLMHAYLQHVCAFHYLKPIHIYVAGTGIAAVMGAAHDAYYLASKVNTRVKVTVLKDMVLDTDSTHADPVHGDKVGDWAHEYWAKWSDGCDPLYPACRELREMLASSARVCLQPPCLPEVIKVQQARKRAARVLDGKNKFQETLGNIFGGFTKSMTG